MVGSATWIRDTQALTCLAQLEHRRAVQRLRKDPAASAAMYHSDQWDEARRWALRWAASDRVYERALLCGFAAQHDVQSGAMRLRDAELWAFRSEVRHVPYLDTRAATPLRGADLATAAGTPTLVESWIDELERYIVPEPATPAARDMLMRSGIALVTWLGNHLSRLPDQRAAAPDRALRGVRRAWSDIAPGGVTRVQTDAVRRLYLGSCANGYQTGRTVGIIPWIWSGRSIETARSITTLATSWAVSVDEADPMIARFSRAALKRRQNAVRARTQRELEPARDAPLTAIAASGVSRAKVA